MYLHSNIETSHYPAQIRKQYYLIEKIVRFAQKQHIEIFSNSFFSTDFVEYELIYKNGILQISVRQLDTNSVPVEYYDVTGLSFFGLCQVLNQIDLID
jgi:hypothetical protein